MDSVVRLLEVGYDRDGVCSQIEGMCFVYPVMSIAHAKSLSLARSTNIYPSHTTTLHHNDPTPSSRIYPCVIIPFRPSIHSRDYYA